jgi:hypothetical protein
MSAITEALAGFLSSSDSGKVARGGATSTHQVFMETQLLPLANKLQREIRGRRFRVCIVIANDNVREFGYFVATFCSLVCVPWLLLDWNLLCLASL